MKLIILKNIELKLPYLVFYIFFLAYLALYNEIIIIKVNTI